MPELGEPRSQRSGTKCRVIRTFSEWDTCLEAYRRDIYSTKF